jgi:hypothetical protein
MHRDRGAVSYRGGVLAVIDHRFLSDPINSEFDLVPDTVRNDLHTAFLAAQREWHCDDRL